MKFIIDYSYYMMYNKHGFILNEDVLFCSLNKCSDCRN